VSLGTMRFAALIIANESATAKIMLVAERAGMRSVGAIWNATLSLHRKVNSFRCRAAGGLAPRGCFHLSRLVASSKIAASRPVIRGTRRFNMPTLRLSGCAIFIMYASRTRHGAHNGGIPSQTQSIGRTSLMLSKTLFFSR